MSNWFETRITQTLGQIYGPSNKGVVESRGGLKKNEFEPSILCFQEKYNNHEALNSKEMMGENFYNTQSIKKSEDYMKDFADQHKNQGWEVLHGLDNAAYLRSGNRCMKIYEGDDGTMYETLTTYNNDGTTTRVQSKHPDLNTHNPKSKTHDTPTGKKLDLMW